MTRAKKESKPCEIARPESQSSRIYWWVAAVAAILLCIFLFSFPIGDADFFWHLETGRIIAETRSIPHQEPFSYTAQGAKWITHEWLFELITWLVYKAGSYPALCVLRILFVLMAIMFPVLLYRNARVSPLWVFICAATGTVILLTRLDWRPLILTTLLFSVFIYILENFVERRSNVLWPLPVLAAIWANWHAGVLFGIALVAYYMIWELIRKDRRPDKSSTPSWLRLAIVLIACAFCALFNPSTVDVLLYPLRLSKVYSQVILRTNTVTELQSLAFGRIPAFWFSAALFLTGAIFSWRRINWRHFLILIVLALASIYRLRLTEIYVPAFAAFAPILLQSITDGIYKWCPRRPAVAAHSLIGTGGLIVVLLLAKGSMTGPPMLGYREDAFPAGTSDWVERFNPPGDMYNDFAFGGYLIHRFYPQRRVFWWGELLVFEPIFQRLAHGETIEDIHHIDLAIDMQSQSGVNPYGVEQWALVCFDSTSSLYLSRSGAASSLIAEHEYFTLGPYEPEQALRNIDDYSPEMKEQVASELERFLEENHRDHARSYAIGAYLMLGGQYTGRALELLKAGLLENPWYPEYWHCSALYDFRAGDLASAEKTIRSMLFWWPRSIKSRFLLGRILAARGHHDTAVRIFRAVLRGGYNFPETHLALARELHELGDDTEAMDELDKYFKTVFPQDYETREYADAVALGKELLI